MWLMLMLLSIVCLSGDCGNFCTWVSWELFWMVMLIVSTVKWERRHKHDSN